MDYTRTENAGIPDDLDTSAYALSKRVWREDLSSKNLLLFVVDSLHGIWTVIGGQDFIGPPLGLWSNQLSSLTVSTASFQDEACPLYIAYFRSIYRDSSTTKQVLRASCIVRQETYPSTLSGHEIRGH